MNVLIKSLVVGKTCGSRWEARRLRGEAARRRGAVKAQTKGGVTRVKGGVISRQAVGGAGPRRPAIVKEKT